MAVRRPTKERSSIGVDERLLVEAAQRDPAEFDALYELFFDRVYFYLSSRVQDRATAEDLTSEVFHKALANLLQFEWRGIPFAAWLFRIASNSLVDQYKRASREHPASEDPPDPAPPTDNSPGGLETSEYHSSLYHLVDRLPAAQRRVIRERFVEQRTIREIAARLNKSEGAVKQLQFRALQTLRSQMGGGHA
jgi:RNA polymerase sigma-70 factor, ECF subfamily